MRKDTELKESINIEEDININNINFINYVEYGYEQLVENIQLFVFSVVSFTLPFVMSHPQLLLGSVVNMLLVLCALNVKGHKLWTIILMPNLGVLANGVLFGSFTKFLLYFAPLIWIGNALLVFGFKYFRFKHKKGIITSITIAICLKVILLGTYAFILIKLSIVPNVFLYAMSVMQLTTAILGSIAAISTTYALKKILKDGNISFR